MSESSSSFSSESEWRQDEDEEILMAGGGFPPPPSSHTSTGLHIVLPGQVLVVEPGFLRGHGTFLRGEKLVASVCGVIERTNKLVTVRPLKSRYAGDVGDVVVGRITATGQKAWNVDVNGRLDARLQLAAIHLPGGAQRRRTADDELNMRSFFTEDDLITAEIQAVHQDGSVALHTRSMKYGRLGEGLFVKVTSGLVRRTQQHFCSLPCGVDAILGMNGYIWLTSPIDPHDESEKLGLAPTRLPITPDLRAKLARVRNAILALDRVFVTIFEPTIMDVYSSSVELDVATKTMLDEEVILTITEAARERARGLQQANQRFASNTSTTAAAMAIQRDESDEEDDQRMEI
jgi:exosome complex component RRP4